MLLKWIRCHADDASAFSREQLRWGKLTSAPGFAGQFGGWDRSDATLACVLGCWEDAASYASFMNDLHDEIFDAGQQAATYSSIDVILATVELTMAGQQPRLPASGGFLRVADCQLFEDREDHFVATQRDIWATGMAAAGMVAGAFARAEPNRFLVFSRWPSAEVHDAYRQGVFTSLRERATPGRDLQALAGFGVALDPSWTVRA